MTAVLLALGSSLSYGVSDFLGGLKSRSIPILVVLLGSQLAALVVMTALALAIGEAFPSGAQLGFAAAAGVAEAVGVSALYRGLASGTVGVVAPIGALAPIVPLVVAVAFLAEVPSPLSGAGIALALGGVLLAGASGSAGSGRREPRSVGFGLVSAAGLGTYLVVMDAAAADGVVGALLVARLVSSLVFGIAIAIVPPRRGPRAAELPVLATVGVLILGADAMYGFATTLGLLSIVAVLSTLYPVVTLLLGRVVLHERLGRGQAAGVVLTLIGAAAISLG